MKVRFSGQGLGTTGNQGIQSDVHQTMICQRNIRVTEPRRIEMTGQELQQSEMRRDDVVYMLLSFRKTRLVSGRKFLFSEKWIGVSVANQRMKKLRSWKHTSERC
jgi:hypothetical protein